MSDTTYLQAVNGVMRRLRETEVTTVSETAYSKLIGDFVNDARDYVEGRYNWIGLEESIEVLTSSGTAEYSIDTVGDQASIKQVIDSTNNNELRHMDIRKLHKEADIDSVTDAFPTHYAISGYASDGDPLITFRPTPNGAYSIKVHTDKTGIALTDSADVIVPPPNLVIQLALALARGERGETGGASDLNTFPLADIYIQNAIIIEAAKRPHDLVWTVEGERSEQTNWST